MKITVIDPVSIINIVILCLLVDMAIGIIQRITVSMTVIQMLSILRKIIVIRKKERVKYNEGNNYLN